MIWPLIVFFCSRRRLLQTAFVVTLGSLVLRIVMQAHGTPELVIRSFTLCRLDTFALGGAAALLLDSDRFRIEAKRFAVPVMVPLFLISAGLFYLSERLFVSLGYTVVASAFTLLIVATVVFADCPLTAILRTKTMRFFGKYSYAIYVFHMPIQRVVLRKLPLLRIADRTHSALAPILCNILVVAALSLFAAIVSWSLIEKRALAYKRYFPEPPSRLAVLLEPHELTA